jgi:hypothetical protein
MSMKPACHDSIAASIFRLAGGEARALAVSGNDDYTSGSRNNQLAALHAAASVRDRTLGLPNAHPRCTSRQNPEDETSRFRPDTLRP